MHYICDILNNKLKNRTMEVKQVIRENIKAFRIEFGYSQENIGSFLGINHSLISKFENGERDINMTYLIKLADLYNIDVVDFSKKNAVKNNASFAVFFRRDNHHEADLKEIALFQNIIRNYLKMNEIEKRYEKTV